MAIEDSYRFAPSWGVDVKVWTRDHSVGMPQDVPERIGMLMNPLTMIAEDRCGRSMLMNAGEARLHDLRILPAFKRDACNHAR
jgi:hypothetical protein